MTCNRKIAWITLILFGGERSKNAFKRLFVYHFDRNKWVTSKLNASGDLNFPESVANHSAAILKNKLYVFGGDERNDCMFCLDLKSAEWQQYGGTVKHETNTSIPSCGVTKAKGVRAVCTFYMDHSSAPPCRSSPFNAETCGALTL